MEKTNIIDIENFKHSASSVNTLYRIHLNGFVVMV